ncbi:MAG: hypothetical protein R3F20_19230 [Planctomycetota bacterium]
MGLAASETRLDFGPYVSPDPVIALRRARATLDVPAGVTLSMRDDVLVAGGGAPAAWRARLEVAALEIPGIRAVDARGLVDHDDRELTRRLEALALRVVVFEAASIEVTPRQDPEIDAAAADLRRLLETARALGRTVRLEIVGLPDRLDAATAPRFEDDPEFYRARSSTALDRADAVRRLVAARAPELRDELTSIGANERAWRSEAERSQAAKLGPAVIFRGVINSLTGSGNAKGARSPAATAPLPS